MACLPTAPCDVFSGTSGKKLMGHKYYDSAIGAWRSPKNIPAEELLRVHLELA